MDKLIINGGKSLQGVVDIGGSKNAATPIIAASILTKKDCLIKNVPEIDDVRVMLEILKGMGAKIFFKDHALKINTADVNPKKLSKEKVKLLRSSILFIGPILARFGEIKIPYPGGCNIGSRPIDTHLDAFRSFGVNIRNEGENYVLKVKKLKPARVVLKEFSVTATENILMFSSLIPGKSEIKIAAAEPHVQDLSFFLRKLGSKINGVGTHTLKIYGTKKLNSVSHTIIPDNIEAITFAIAGVITKGKLEIKNIEPNHLDLPILKLREFGANIKILKKSLIAGSYLKLKACKVEARTYPGIPTDLQASFGLLATQAEGTSLIHDTIFEGRLKYIDELNKMGANAVICDPHRALITGPTPLYGQEIRSYDLRSGATMILAALIASGRSEISEASQVDRGYERIDERLRAVGADIKRVKA